jgi:uncharacterized HAD superfamily protein
MNKCQKTIYKNQTQKKKMKFSLKRKEEEISIIMISSSSETESGDKYEVAELLAERRKHNKTEY